MVWIILGVFILIIIISMTANKKSYYNQLTKDPAKLMEPVAAKAKISTLNYFIGHPKINDPCSVFIFQGEDQLEISYRSGFDYENDNPRRLSFIPYNAIENIVIEDQTSIERKVTVGRILLTGIFALAWKKKKIKEAAYVTITWKQGQFTHETIFSIEGKNSVATANTARNSLLRWVAD